MTNRSKAVKKLKLVKPMRKVTTSVVAYGGDICGGSCGMLKW